MNNETSLVVIHGRFSFSLANGNIFFIFFLFYRFIKSAPMFLDRNFKRLGKISYYLPPFGIRTQGKNCSSLSLQQCLPTAFYELVRLFLLGLLFRQDSRSAFSVQATKKSRESSGSWRCLKQLLNRSLFNTRDDLISFSRHARLFEFSEFC